MKTKNKAFALIQIGNDLCFSDFVLTAEPGEDFDDFSDIANYHFHEKHGPESVDITFRIVDYFEEPAKYKIIEIVLCQSADPIPKEHTHKRCEKCKGSGLLHKEDCDECHGYGRVKI